MLYIPSKNLLYLRVPRTASTSTSHFLYENVALKFDDSIYTPIYYKNILLPSKKTLNLDVHVNAEELLKKNILTDVENIKIYGIIRNPVDRFKSVMRKKNIHDMSEYEKLKNFFLPQTNWLKIKNKLISNIYSYEKIDEMIIDILKTLDIDCAITLNRHRIEERPVFQFELSNSIISRIKKDYYEDIKLYEDIKSRE